MPRGLGDVPGHGAGWIHLGGAQQRLPGGTVERSTGSVDIGRIRGSVDPARFGSRYTEPEEVRLEVSEFGVWSGSGADQLTPKVHSAPLLPRVSAHRAAHADWAQGKWDPKLTWGKRYWNCCFHEELKRQEIRISEAKGGWVGLRGVLV